MGQSSGRWGDLRLRVLSALVMVPVAIVCIVLGGAAFTLMVGLLAVGMAHEWIRMCRADPGPRTVLAFAALPLAVVVTAIGHPGFAAGLLALVTAAAVVRRPGGEHDRLLPFGLPYIGLGAIALVWLRLMTGNGAVLVIVLLLVVWASDIGAYVVGRAVGGPKLAPRISPGKTRSGAVGGLLASMAVGALAAGWIDVPLWLAAVAAGVIGCIGQAGDLLESGLKRRFGVKDSGTSIPGHGGLLDRLDAVLTAAPAAAILAIAMGRGVIDW